jgi:hypothetical protein
MGNARFLYSNLITSSTMITVSTASTGTITQAVKDGTGSAIISLSGTYTGYEDIEYTVECDGTTAGTTVGAATIRWSDGATWDATTVATSTAASTITNGVSIAFADSTMTFSTGDKWYFKGINRFSPAKMLDLNRDTRFRSGGLETTNLINIDLGAAGQAQAIILYDHNLTSAAVITLLGASVASTNSSFSSPGFSTTVPWSSAKTLHYLSTGPTYRYWQVKVSNTAIADGYIEIGELFLGAYTELSANIEEGYSEETNFLVENNITPYGVERCRYYNTQRSWDVNYKAMSTADVVAMGVLTSSVTSRSAGTLKPFWFNLDSTQTDKNYLVKINGLRVEHMTGDRYQIPLGLKEVVRSV